MMVKGEELLKDLLMLTFGDDFEVLLNPTEAKDLRDYLIEKFPLDQPAETSEVTKAALAVEKARSG